MEAINDWLEYTSYIISHFIIKIHKFTVLPTQLLSKNANWNIQTSQPTSFICSSSILTNLSFLISNFLAIYLRVEICLLELYYSLLFICRVFLLYLERSIFCRNIVNIDDELSVICSYSTILDWLAYRNHFLKIILIFIEKKDFRLSFLSTDRRNNF